MATSTAATIVVFLFLINHSVASDSDALRTVISDLHYHRLHPTAVDPCTIPGITCISHQATRVSIPSRRLNGSISPSIGRLSHLLELSLPGNRLSGELPKELAGCISLQTLILRQNLLSGEVGKTIKEMVNLRVLDLSSNRFSGELGFLRHLPNLEKLSLSNNLFSGMIPRSFSRTLLTVDLSGNPELTGELPGTALRQSVQTNPTRHILKENSTRKSNTSATAAAAPAPAPAASTTHRHHKRHKARNWIVGFIAGSFAGTISGFILSVLFRLLMNCIRRRFKDPSGPTVFSQMIKLPDDLAFLTKEDGLESLEVIGRGGCGEVYRTQLVSDPNKTIAVKKIMKRTLNGAEPTAEESGLLDKWMRQIRSEILTVGSIRHRNLLPLLAHVARPDCHYLVYEFMKNGSLHDLLINQDCELSWPDRHKIATGIAAGLEYLHHSHHPRIIHRDLKPGNILLDDEMEAKIADFGLAKEMSENHTHMSTSNVAGTFGYIAPEYYQTLKFTAKCDIYSFGVILAVLVIGKMPSDEFFQDTEEISLVKWLRMVMSSANPEVAIDPQLAEQGHEEAMLLMLKIAYFCTQDDPKERPTSKDVKHMLSQIKHLPTGARGGDAADVEDSLLLHPGRSEGAADQ